MRKESLTHLLIALLYLSFSVVTVMLYPVTKDITWQFMGNEEVVCWVMRDICVYCGLIWGASIAFITDELLRKVIAKVAIGYGSFDLAMLLMYNNQYSEFDYLFNLTFVICSFLYTYKKIKRK
jgi:hypothetical protein